MPKQKTSTAVFGGEAQPRPRFSQLGYNYKPSQALGGGNGLVEAGDTFTSLPGLSGGLHSTHGGTNPQRNSEFLKGKSMNRLRKLY